MPRYKPDGWLGFLLGTTLWYGITQTTIADTDSFNAKVDELASVLYHITTHTQLTAGSSGGSLYNMATASTGLYENIYGTGKKLPDYDRDRSKKTANPPFIIVEGKAA